jgi:hypothetical protein
MALSFEQAYPVLYKGWDQNSARADFNATGGQNKAGYQELVGGGSSSSNNYSSSSSGSGSFNIIDYAKQLLGFQQEANQPAIQSLQAGIPEVQNKISTEQTRLEGEKVPLTARYEQLLKDVTSRTEMATAQEFGRRGIPTTSGLLDKTLAEKISPETERIGLAKNADISALDKQISDLTGVGIDKVREIQNTIAQLQAGAGQNAVSGALNMSQIGEQQRQFNAGNELSKLQLENQTKQTNYDINKPYSSGDSTGFDLTALIEALNPTLKTEEKPANPYDPYKGAYSSPTKNSSNYGGFSSTNLGWG